VSCVKRAQWAEGSSDADAPSLIPSLAPSHGRSVGASGLRRSNNGARVRNKAGAKRTFSTSRGHYWARNRGLVAIPAGSDGVTIATQQGQARLVNTTNFLVRCRLRAKLIASRRDTTISPFPFACSAATVLLQYWYCSCRCSIYPTCRPCNGEPRRYHVYPPLLLLLHQHDSAPSLLHPHFKHTLPFYSTGISSSNFLTLCTQDLHTHTHTQRSIAYRLPAPHARGRGRQRRSVARKLASHPAAWLSSSLFPIKPQPVACRLR
jgi:hypothetical protein